MSAGWETQGGMLALVVIGISTELVRSCSELQITMSGYE